MSLSHVNPILYLSHNIFLHLSCPLMCVCVASFFCILLEYRDRLFDVCLLGSRKSTESTNNSKRITHTQATLLLFSVGQKISFCSACYRNKGKNLNSSHGTWEKMLIYNVGILECEDSPSNTDRIKLIF